MMIILTLTRKCLTIADEVGDNLGSIVGGLVTMFFSVS